MNEKFVWSDAWILLAIIYAGAQANRATIKSIADGIEHAIPTEDELEGAFSRLTSAGFIEEAEGQFKVSSVVMETYLRIHTPRRAVFKEMEDIRRFLEVT